MFTGLVETVGELVETAPHAGGVRARIAAPFASELGAGESVAVNGVCLTSIAHTDASFDPLHEFVPLYFVPKTPTLYAIVNQGLQDEIFFIEINSEILNVKEKIILFTDGNAASDNTAFFDKGKIALNYIDFNVLESIYWNDFPDGKRKRNAEILVHEKIEPKYFNSIIVNNKILFDYIIKKLDSMNWKGLEENFKVEINKEFFF